MKKGEFVLVDYTAKVKDSGELIVTTIKEDAKASKEGVYEPELIIVGEGWGLPGLDEILEGMEPGDEKEVDIPPEKAFGKKDPAKIRVVSARDLVREGVTPRVGEVVNFRGETGRVIYVGGGRVIIDFNHPLAGKTLIYKVKVHKRIESIKEKAKSLLFRRLRELKGTGEFSEEKVKLLLRKGDLTVEFDSSLLNTRVPHAIPEYVNDIKKYLPDIENLKIVFPFKIKEETKEEKVSESSKATSQN